MRIAILGAGKVGTAVARVALAAGHEVRIAGSGDPTAIDLIIDMVAPGALALWAADAVAAADLVILSLPFPKYRSLDPAMLNGTIVIDAMNYWKPTDGIVADVAATGSSEAVAEFLSGARVVKSLSHIGYHELEEEARPVGSAERRALAVVSDDLDAAHVAAEFIRSIGYNAVMASPLSAGRVLEPGSALFGLALPMSELQNALGPGTRLT